MLSFMKNRRWIAIMNKPAESIGLDDEIQSLSKGLLRCFARTLARRNKVFALEKASSSRPYPGI